MKPIKFDGVTHHFGQGQRQYSDLPGHYASGRDGRVTFCWRLGWMERLQVLFTGCIWHQVLTFRGHLQPQKLMVDKPLIEE